MEKRYALRDEQWERLQGLGLPGCDGHVGVTAKDNRLFVEAVLYRFRAGIPWRDLPPRFGNWHRVYVRFNRWSKQGVWLKIFTQLFKDSSNEYNMIDSTIVRAHRSAEGARKKGVTVEESKERQCIGRSKGGLTTKIHAVCDALGRPTELLLTQGQVSDLAGFDGLSAKIKADTLIGDKGYDADERVRMVLQKAGKTAVIPPKSNRKNPALHTYDKELCKKRHRIENFFGRLKDYRGIATRFEKTLRNFLAGIHLAAAMTWLN